MKKQIIPIVMCMISAIIITGATANEISYDIITQEDIIKRSDFIAVVEKTGIDKYNEKIFTGLFSPSFEKYVSYLRVIEVLYEAPGLSAVNNGYVKVVMPNYMSKLSVHKSYYKDNMSLSPIYDSYRPDAADFEKCQQFIIYAKQHYEMEGFFSNVMVQVDGMLEWTSENSYDPVSAKSVINGLLKSLNKKQ